MELQEWILENCMKLLAGRSWLWFVLAACFRYHFLLPERRFQRVKRVLIWMVIRPMVDRGGRYAAAVLFNCYGLTVSSLARQNYLFGSKAPLPLRNQQDVGGMLCVVAGPSRNLTITYKYYCCIYDPRFFFFMAWPSVLD